MRAHCSMTFVVPEGAAYAREEVRESIQTCVLENCYAQLLWLLKGMTAEKEILDEMGINLDYRVVKQAESLLTTLSAKYPGLCAAIGGGYDPYPENRLKRWCDDMGGYFQVILENGKVAVDDTPIV